MKSKIYTEGHKDNTVKAKFAEGLCFKKLFFIFLVGSVIGSLYEEILCMIQNYIANGTWVWSLRRGVIYGPFNVIYGFGAVVVIYFLLRKPRKWWETFLYSAVLGGVVEYVVGWLQEVVTHTKSWDYSGYFLSIGGRTTVLFMVVWGFLGLVLVKWVYPLVSSWIERIPVRIGDALFVGLLVFMICDMLISWSAIVRQTLRHNDVPPLTPVGRFLDECYPDEYLVKYFPNMEHEDLK